MIPDPYRNAYETAFAELTQITAQFEQLRTRKNQVENLIAVLQPIFDEHETAPEPQSSLEMESGSSPEQFTAEAPAQDAEPEPAYSFLNVPNPIAESMGDSNSDPFERRMRSGFRFRGLSATQRSY